MEEKEFIEKIAEELARRFGYGFVGMNETGKEIYRRHAREILVFIKEIS